jgi:hypothetical protein
MKYRPTQRIATMRVDMACSKMTIRLTIAIAACVGTPGTLLAQQHQYQTPGYTAPTTDAPDNDTFEPLNAAPQPDPATVPDLTFRDRLQKLNNVGPATNARPGFTTSDTTSSYSTSEAPSDASGNTTRNTTSSYTTTPDPAR